MRIDHGLIHRGSHRVIFPPPRYPGFRGLGDAATVPVNVGPGVIIQMTPADAAAWWGTEVQATPGSYGGYQGTGGQVTAGSGGSALNPLGVYSPAAIAAFEASPTIQWDIPQTPGNLSAPGFSPNAPQREPENTALGPGTTMVLTLDSYLQEKLAEMTSMGPNSSAAAGGPNTLYQQAVAYCGATGVDCSNLQQLVQKYGTWFNNWASQTLLPGVTPTGVTMTWSGASPQPGVTYLGQSPSGVLPGEGLNLPGGVQDIYYGSSVPSNVSGPNPYSDIAGGYTPSLPGSGGGIPGSQVKLGAGATGTPKTVGGAAGSPGTVQPGGGFSLSDLFGGGTAGGTTSTGGTGGVSAIPSWVWIAGAVAVAFMMFGRRR